MVPRPPRWRRHFLRHYRRFRPELDAEWSHYVGEEFERARYTRAAESHAHESEPQSGAMALHSLVRSEHPPAPHVPDERGVAAGTRQVPEPHADICRRHRPRPLSTALLRSAERRLAPGLRSHH